MFLKENTRKYIKQPYPLWENDLTTLLIRNKWSELIIHRQINPGNYSTAACLHDDPYNITPVKNKTVLSFNCGNGIIDIGHPMFECLQAFYDEHGLILLAADELAPNNASIKIKSAFNILERVPLASMCIQKLVRSIHVLKQEDAEIDVSYSHPCIPFSIFISICQDSSMLSNLRVAESILHEAMHLKLTLIEGITPLVKLKARGRYYSPWRDELRPAQGVLHGLFVFRAILDFYNAILADISSILEIDYLQYRIDQIIEELSHLKSFSSCDDLTVDGANLTENLLP